MHILTAITIRNFRSCESVTLDLAPYTPFVGYDNAGKSNILSAIRWLVAPFALTAADYLQADRPIQVDGTITGSPPRCTIGWRHATAARCSPSSTANPSRSGASRPNRAPRKTARSTSSTPASPQPFARQPRRQPGSPQGALPRAIVIGAMEDAVEDAAKAKTTSTIGKLLAEFTGAIEDAHAHELSQVLQQLRDSFSANGAQRSTALKRFDDAATGLVHDFFPGVRLHLEIRVPDMSAMLKGGTIKVSEREGGGAQGLRARNAFSLIA